LAPEKIWKDRAKLRPVPKTSIYTSYVHNNFPCLRSRVSEIRVGDYKSHSKKIIPPFSRTGELLATAENLKFETSH